MVAAKKGCTKDAWRPNDDRFAAPETISRRNRRAGEEEEEEDDDGDERLKEGTKTAAGATGDRRPATGAHWCFVRAFLYDRLWSEVGMESELEGPTKTNQRGGGGAAFILLIQSR